MARERTAVTFVTPSQDLRLFIPYGGIAYTARRVVGPFVRSDESE
jgi:hypothetical protein